MRATICACDREPSYLDTSLSYLPEDTQVVFQSEKPVEGRIWTARMYDDTQHNARFNYAMSIWYSEGLVLEDDVQVSRNWTQWIDEVTSIAPDGDYIIALYACYQWRTNGQLDLVPYNIENFYGTQAMLFSESIREKLAHWILTRLDTEDDEPHDFAIKSFCNEYRVPLYATTYSLAQHIGQVTTGLGHHHQCKNFIDEFAITPR